MRATSFFGDDSAHQKRFSLEGAQKLVFVDSAEDVLSLPVELLDAYPGGREALVSAADAYYSVNPPYAQRSWKTVYETELHARMTRAWEIVSKQMADKRSAAACSASSTPTLSSIKHDLILATVCVLLDWRR